MSKTCDYCEKAGTYTFTNGETMCAGCLTKFSGDPRELRQTIQHLRDERRWRTIEETPPHNLVNGAGESFAFVLCYMENGTVVEDYFKDGEPPFEATHWMPLPEPPEQEDGQ